MSEDNHERPNHPDPIDGPVPQGQALTWPPGRLVASEPAPVPLVLSIDEIGPLPDFSLLTDARRAMDDACRVPPALIWQEPHRGYDRPSLVLYEVVAHFTPCSPRKPNGRAKARRERRHKIRGRR